LGRKRTRPGKYAYFCIAGLIFLTCSGCAALETIERKRAAHAFLDLSRQLLSRGNYEEALKASEKTLTLSEGQSPGDKALFTMALVRAHHDNPQKDYRKSVEYFTRLRSEYPQSPLVEQSRIWTAVLERTGELERRTAEKKKEKDKENKKEIKHVVSRKVKERPSHLQLSRQQQSRGKYEDALKASEKILSSAGTTTARDEALFANGLVYVHYDNPKKDYKRSMGYFQRLVNEYPQSPLLDQAKVWIDVLQVIEKLHKVDSVVEQIKKKQSR